MSAGKARAPALRAAAPAASVFGLAFAISMASLAPVQATVSGQNGKIVYEAGPDHNTEIHLIDPDGSNRVRLTDSSADDTDPVWSPDGRAIAFTSDRDGDSAIYLMDADGSNQRRLVGGSDPTWTPDGTGILYEGPDEVRDPSHPQYGQTFLRDLFVVSVETGVSVRLTDAANDPRWSSTTARSVTYRDPAWSPDGQYFAYIRHVGGPTPTANAFGHSLLVGALDDPHQIAAGPFSGRDDPDWAPDGRSIIVVEGNSLFGPGSNTVLIVDPATGGTQTLALSLDLLEAPLHASFSPDGEQLLLTTGNPSLEIRLYRVAVDGLARTLVTENGAVAAWQPLNLYPMGLVDPATGMWRLRDATGLVRSFYYGNPGDHPFMGDWDCDGADTPGLFRRSDGYVYLRNANTQGTADREFFFGNPGDIPIAGDFNNDGCDTVSVYRPSQSRFFIVNELGEEGGGLGAAEFDYYFGNPGDTPFAGDFDGNGTDTVGLHRSTTGLVYLRNSHTQGVADDQFLFGNPGDRFVAYDWSHDGVDTPATFRPGNTTHYFRFTNTQGAADARYIWGHSTWYPVAGSFGHR